MENQSMISGKSLRHLNQIIVAASAKLHQAQIRFIPMDSILALSISKAPASKIDLPPQFSFGKALLGGGDIPHLQFPLVLDDRPVIALLPFVWFSHLTQWHDRVLRVLL